MNNKMNNNELPQSIKKVLFEHASTAEAGLSRLDLDNAWKVFCNRVDAEQLATSAEPVSAGSILFFNRIGSAISSLCKPVVLIPAVSTASLLFTLLSYHSMRSNQFGVTAYTLNEKRLANVESYEVKEQTPRTQNDSIVEIKNEAREYRLPQANQFSELVRFVATEQKQVINPYKTVLDQKLTAEIESSLKESVSMARNEYFQDQTIKTATVDNSANVFFVSHER